ncbi:MAG: hypothetical protein LBR07_00220 [Puniceicoccales bacterium]|jgi:hypothetical protein|nr:hypothetical protein [Puniceicoccales bacterium]
MSSLKSDIFGILLVVVAWGLLALFDKRPPRPNYRDAKPNLLIESTNNIAKRTIKIELIKEAVEAALPDNPTAVAQVLSKNAEVANEAEEADAKEKSPSEEKAWALVVLDAPAEVRSLDLTGYAFQYPASESPHLIKERIYRAVYEFNTTKKGRKSPVSNIGDAAEIVPAKHWKEAGAKPRNKEPAYVVFLDNEVPTEQ